MTFQPFHVLMSWGKLVLMLSLTVSIVKAEDSSRPLFLGDPSCPCVAEPSPISPFDLLNKNDEINISTYGIGCGQHDANLSQCKTSDPLCDKDIHEPSPSCNKSWCSRQWCYVDPDNCSLYKKESFHFPNSNRFYSYSTCYEKDEFTPTNPLADRILRVGLNCNTAGYGGSYCILDGCSHFEPPFKNWKGPAIEFISELKNRSGFKIKVTEPPDQLVEKSTQYFEGSKNMFDLCVYAVGLGYLDLCVAQYSVTDLRIRTGAEWFVLSQDPVYLFVFEDEPKVNGAVFVEKILTVFKPFQLVAWVLIVFVVIVMGILVVVLDYEKKVEKRLQNQRRTCLKEVVKEIYTSCLSVLQGSHSLQIVSTGGKILLFGFSFFIVVIQAFYLGGLLAVLLTEETSHNTIATLEDVVAKNYTICGQRLQIDTLSEMYETLNLKDYVIKDSDGGRGYSCPTCKDRERVFDTMVRPSSGGASNGCQVAIAPLEDLTALQGDNKHCDKKKVGEPIFYNVWGMPVFHDVAEELIPLMLEVKTDFVYEKEKQEAIPEDKCANKLTNQGVQAIGAWDLLPVWIIFFSCATCALVVKWCHRKKSKRGLNSSIASANTEVVAKTSCRREGRMPVSSSSSGASYDTERTFDSSSDSTIASYANSVTSKELPSDVEYSDWFEVPKAKDDPSSHPSGLVNIEEEIIDQNAKNDHCNDYDECGYPISRKLTLVVWEG